MLRHTGKRRSFLHNLRLSILLCLNAGCINTAGFLALGVLTTNVTGHASGLAIDLVNADISAVAKAIAWLLLFLAGSYCSGMLIGRIGSNKKVAYTVPILIMMVVILSVILLGPLSSEIPEYLSGFLLFAMGMQNALVTMVSGSIVRTTHLTGMFTDLGIGLAQMCTGRGGIRLRQQTILRLAIIGSFIIGGIIGCLAFHHFAIRAFWIPQIILLFTLFYDRFRLQFRRSIGKISRGKQ